MKELDEILGWLDANRNSKNTEGMARFGINVGSAYGVSMPVLRAKAKEYRKRHDVALALWDTGIHEARIMASLTADPALMDERTMDSWVADFDSWDVCDQCCINLLRRLPFAYNKIEVYVAEEGEFARRTGFVLIATLAVHDKKTSDDRFASYLATVEEYSTDKRNFVRKAVNWALRQIGKRSLELNSIAADLAVRLSGSEDATARWIGKDALRELTSVKTLQYIKDHR